MGDPSSLSEEDMSWTLVSPGKAGRKSLTQENAAESFAISPSRFSVLEMAENIETTDSEIREDGEIQVIENVMNTTETEEGKTRLQSRHTNLFQNLDLKLQRRSSLVS